MKHYPPASIPNASAMLRVGDEAFFEILHSYLERYRDRSASTQDFISVAEEISGQELSAFFDSWLLAR